MKVADFDFNLPEEYIAQKPLINREGSKLLILEKENGDICHKMFPDLLDYLSPGDVLVLNDSKVIPARLYGHRESSGGRVEVLLLSPHKEDEWEVLVKPGRRAKPGTVIVFGDGMLKASVLSKTPFGGRVIRFMYAGNFSAVLERLGKTPLPPYIKEELSDSNRYQTVYAKTPGSVASPTAGLHFTPDFLEKVQEKGVHVSYITLHIGLGTFRPVEVQDIEDHTMHQEFFTITKETVDTITKCKEGGKKVVAVGTTSCRVLETCGRDEAGLRHRQGFTNIFIYPGFDFKIVDALLTNFHLPRSTLIMLVSALAGREKVLRAYNEAVMEGYRFYSFGDAMLII